MMVVLGASFILRASTKGPATVQVRYGNTLIDAASNAWAPLYSSGQLDTTHGNNFMHLVEVI